MFKHILIPTDGSDLSKTAINNGVQFAKDMNAKITGLTVTMPFHYFSLDAMQISTSAAQYDADAQALAQRHLNTIKEAASAIGVECELLHRVSENPYEEIVRTAQDRGCDVIFQASHGRRGVSALILGSETQKVLTHSKIPVLVFR